MTQDMQPSEDKPADSLPTNRNGTPTGNAFADGPPPDNPLILDAFDNAAFNTADYRHSWLIDSLLVANEPLVLAGASKSMKTAIAVDAAISLASGKPFVGSFTVPTPIPVYVISAESGPASLQTRMQNVCRAKGIDPAGLPIRWYTRVELLSTLTGCRNLEDALRHFGSKVVILDPSYLLLGGDVTSDNAGNMFAMGRLLANVGTACLNAGATCIVVTHANGRLPIGEPMELSHIAWSGFQQWARQWWLISRRTKYEDDGRHPLYLRYGGSAGHTGLVNLNIDEGVFDRHGGGNHWEVRAVDASEARRAEREEAAADELRVLQENCGKVLLAMTDILADGATVATQNALKTATGLKPTALKAAIQKLVADGSVIEASGLVKCGRATKPAHGICRPGSLSK